MYFENLDGDLWGGEVAEEREDGEIGMGNKGGGVSIE